MPRTNPSAGAASQVDLDVHLPAIRAGDADAFGRWLAGAERPLRLALRHVATRVDVEAVLQETLLRVWQVAQHLQPDGRDNALLRIGHRIARNLAIDELRRARGEPSELDRLDRLLAEAADHRDAGLPDPLLRQRIVECIDRLGGQPAAVFHLRLRDEGRTEDADLAAGLGMRPNTFLQNLSRARRSVAECLEKRGVDLGAWGVGREHTIGDTP